MNVAEANQTSHQPGGKLFNQARALIERALSEPIFVVCIDDTAARNLRRTCYRARTSVEGGDQITIILHGNTLRLTKSVMRDVIVSVQGME